MALQQLEGLRTRFVQITDRATESARRELGLNLVTPANWGKFFDGWLKERNYLAQEDVTYILLAHNIESHPAKWLSNKDNHISSVLHDIRERVNTCQDMPIRALIASGRVGVAVRRAYDRVSNVTLQSQETEMRQASQELIDTAVAKIRTKDVKGAREAEVRDVAELIIAAHTRPEKRIVPHEIELLASIAARFDLSIWKEPKKVNRFIQAVGLVTDDLPEVVGEDGNRNGIQTLRGVIRNLANDYFSPSRASRFDTGPLRYATVRILAADGIDNYSAPDLLQGLAGIAWGDPRRDFGLQGDREPDDIFDSHVLDMANVVGLLEEKYGGHTTTVPSGGYGWNTIGDTQHFLKFLEHDNPILDALVIKNEPGYLEPKLTTLSSCFDVMRAGWMDFSMHQ